jgi:hypothetical protein
VRPHAEDLNERNAGQELAGIPVDSHAWCSEKRDGNPEPFLTDRRQSSEKGCNQGGRKNENGDKKKEEGHR